MLRKRTTGFVITFAGVAAAVWLAVWNSGKPQFAEATRIASVEDWRVAGGDMSQAGPYLWLTPHEIFHFTPGIPGDWDRADVLDTRTGRDQSAPGLVHIEGGHSFAASPDGQWVLWDTQTYSNSPPGMAATRRADGKTVRWPHLQTNWGDGFWMPDSNRWVGVNYLPTGKTSNNRPVREKRIVIYNVNRPGFQSFAIPGDAGSEDILGVTPQGTVIFNDSPGDWGSSVAQAQPPISLHEVSLNGARPTARICSVQVPKTPPGNSYRVSLSPQGDRLLWTCFSTKPNLFFGWFSHLTHRSFGGAVESLDIWTCPLDGTAPSHLGTWSSPRMDFTACWNPDGKHVSMTMNNGLYSIPAP